MKVTEKRIDCTCSLAMLLGGGYGIIDPGTCWWLESGAIIGMEGGTPAPDVGPPPVSRHSERMKHVYINLC